MILTVRDGEPIPPATQEIWKTDQFGRIDLQQLSAEETSTLLAETLAGPVDPDAADRLWKLTRGNALYLRNIVEQEVAGGRVVQRNGYWRWIGDPIMPPGLVDLIESRIGALPTPVSEVIDALAVGEPIELSTPDADHRCRCDRGGRNAGAHRARTCRCRSSRCGVAHPLFGELRRKRAPHSRLRRLRGLVAAELAASDDRDDLRNIVRRATLSLDSDLAPDAELLVRAAHGAVWLGGLVPRGSTGGSRNPSWGGPRAEICSGARVVLVGSG